MRISLIISVALAALVLVAVWVWRDSQRGWTVARLERLIELEVLLSCDRSQVEDWFDRHRIKHSYFVDTTGDRTGSRTMPMEAGLRDEDLSGMERGWIVGPEANVGFGNSGRIQIYFFFDKQGCCVGHLVFPFVYSL